MDVSTKNKTTCIYLPEASVWMYIPKKNNMIISTKNISMDVSTKKNINISISINNESMDVSAKKNMNILPKT